MRLNTLKHLPVGFVYETTSKHEYTIVEHDAAYTRVFDARNKLYTNLSIAGNFEIYPSYLKMFNKLSIRFM